MNNLPGTITLDDRYYIDVDPMNWILKQVKIIPPMDKRGNPNKNAGNRCDAVIGYFASLEKALEAYSDMLIRDRVSGSVAATNIVNLETILGEIKNSVTGLSLTLNAKKVEER